VADLDALLRTYAGAGSISSAVVDADQPSFEGEPTGP
jgi:hypothetical protein